MKPLPRSIFHPLALAAAMLARPAGPLPAAEPPPVRVQTLGLAAEVPEVPPSAPIYLRGNEVEEIALAIEAPLGVKLNVRADLFQVASGNLLAPLAKDLVVADGLDFATRTRRTLRFHLPAPGVLGTTGILLRFRTQAQPAADPAAWQAAGEVSGVVFGNPLTGLLKDELTKREWRLAVFGESLALREFFTQRHVEFEDLGRERPETFNPRIVYVAEEPAGSSAPDVWPSPEAVRGGAKLFLFRARNTPLAGVHTTFAGAGFVVKISLPILVNVANNPVRQTELVNLLRDTIRHTDQSAANH